jgi:hypothetical protein
MMMAAALMKLRSAALRHRLRLGGERNSEREAARDQKGLEV